MTDNRNCDFCNTPNPSYRWVFAKQILPKDTPVEAIEAMIANPEWLACESCHQMILNQNLVGLVDVAMKSMPRAAISQNVEYFTKLYQSLLDNFQQN